MGYIKSATDFMISIANDASHGYDQIYRWGEYGDFDCSSLVILAWEKAGVPVKSNGATYTGNMYNVFVNCGFEDVTASVNLGNGSGLQSGDVLLNYAYHTAMYIGDGQIAQASINEKGTAKSGQPGDQKQLWGQRGEINIRSYYSYPWNCVLRFKEPQKEVKQDSSTPVNNFGLWYRCHIADKGTLDPVHDGQTCGTTGCGKPMQCLWIDNRNIPDVHLDVKAHIEGIGWRLFKDVQHNTPIGTTGSNKRLEAIEIDATGLPAGRKLQFRTHLANSGWTVWVESGFTSGTVGIEKAIEAIQIKIV